METKTIDEYQDIDGKFYAKTRILQKISENLESAINRLSDVRQAYGRLYCFYDENYDTHICIIKEMAVQNTSRKKSHFLPPR